MNITELFSPRQDPAPFNFEMNSLLLNQALAYAVEDKENDFDKILAKTSHLMTEFAVNFVDFGDITDASGNTTTLENKNTYYSFLHLAAQVLSAKYVLKVAHQALQEKDDTPSERYNLSRKNSLIETCFLYHQPQLLSFLVDNEWVSEKNIYEALFLYHNKAPTQQSFVAAQNPMRFFETFKSSEKAVDIAGICRNIQTVMPLVENFNAHDKAHIKNCSVPFLLTQHSRLFGQPNPRELIKSTLMSYMKAGIIEIHTPIKQHFNAFMVDVPGETISEYLDLKAEDINAIMTHKAQSLSQKLKDTEQNKPSRLKVKI